MFRGHEAAVNIEGSQIRLTDHAIKRVQTRYPEFAKLDRIDLCRGVAREIADSIRGEQVAKTRPRWAVLADDGDGRRAKGYYGTRYVWNDEHTHIYSVKQVNDGTVVVITAFWTRPEEA